MWWVVAPIALVVVALLSVYVTGPPASVAVTDDLVRITLRGLWPVLAMRRTVVVPRAAIVNAAVVADARPLLHGFRVGTHVPGGPIAGRFTSSSSTAFWAVKRRRALVLDVSEGRFSRLVVEVDRPDELAAELHRDATSVTPSREPAPTSDLAAKSVATEVVLVAVAVLGLIVAALLTSRSVPSPLATHWAWDRHPNGHMTMAALVVVLVVVTVVAAVPWILAARRGARNPMPALAAAVWATTAVAMGSTIVANWHKSSWAEARLPAWTLPSLLACPLIIGALAYRANRRA